MAASSLGSLASVSAGSASAALAPSVGEVREQGVPDSAVTLDVVKTLWEAISCGGTVNCKIATHQSNVFMFLFNFRASLQSVLDCQSKAVIESSDLDQFVSDSMRFLGTGMPTPMALSISHKSLEPSHRIPCSMYGRILLAVALTEMAAIDSVSWLPKLSKLSKLFPPVGTWSSQPYHLDGWIDPADEMFVVDSKYTWEAEVRIAVRIFMIERNCCCVQVRAFFCAMFVLVTFTRVHIPILSVQIDTQLTLFCPCSDCRQE